MKTETEKQLRFENEELQLRLTEAEEMLNAIRNGEVDAIVVSGQGGEKIFSLASAETPYRIIVEEMNEGAATISADGTILYCNQRLAELVSIPLEQLIGSNFTQFVVESDKPEFQSLLQSSIQGKSNGNIIFADRKGNQKQFHLSFNPLPPNVLGDICIMTADITELKQKEAELRQYYDTLEQQVIDRTAELTHSIGEFAASRRATLNMMEDAVEAKNEMEIAKTVLEKEIIVRRISEEQLKLFAVILEHLNRQNEWQNLIRDILKEIKSFTGFDAVGIRFRDGEDYPYFVQNGFSGGFLETENQLCSRNSKGEIFRDKYGRPYLECMCGNIICGRTDPSKPFFTEHGSFWTNGTTELLSSTTEEDLQARTRNRCNKEGFESVALIPLQSDGEIIGLLQLNDKLPGRLTQGMIKFFEEVGSTIGLAYRRLKNEERIKESEAKYRELTDSLPQTVFEMDLKGNLSYTNKNAYKMFGFSEEDFNSGINVFDLVDPGDRQSVLDDIARKLKGESPLNYDYKAIRKDGSKFPVNIYSSIIFNDGVPKGIRGFIVDITEPKRVEKELLAARCKAEELNRLKSSFLANMSHELRTPMVGILGFSQLLAEADDFDDVKEYSSLINSSGKRLMETLNLILNISRIDSGELQLEYREIELIEIVNDTINLFKALADKNNINITVDSIYEHLWINTSQQAVEGILNNLINNAVKFTDKGSITVAIDKEKNDSGEWVVIDVIDTGIGIAEEHYDIIFHEFRQVSEGIGRNFEGTGLGLSLTKKYVNILGGTISLKSQINAGSTFTVRFPFKSEFNSAKRTKTEAEIIPVLQIPEFEPNAIKKTILLVEDDNSAIIYVKKILNIFELDIVTNAADAIKKASENQYSLILMDINLSSGMDGIYATKEIRKLQNNKDIPIIAMTAFAMVGDKEEFIAAGCSHYISKPFFKDDFLALIVEALKEA